MYYRITDTTHIAKVPMKRLLSHVKTKMDLTVYKVMESARLNRRCLVVAWGCQCEATHKCVEHLQSNQEEADTKILLHAVDATTDGATELQIHSPDTDVFVLSLRRYPELCEKTSFVTGKGQNHRMIDLKPIVNALGPTKTAALPAFHSLTGSDNTGNFAGKGKLTCWKIFLQSNDDTISSLAKLGTEENPEEETVDAVERFVCQLYLPKTSISTVKELRWLLFKKKQAQAERLPPTQGALCEAILRAHYQTMVWNNDTVPNPQLPSPQNYGWQQFEDEWQPVKTKLPPAPEAIIQLVKCGCSKERCSTNRCQCRKAELRCTDLCACSDSEPCDNVHDENESEDDSEDDSEDECEDEDDDQDL